MKTVTIRELLEQTGRWVQQALAGEVYVTERGRPVAKITPVAPLPQKPFFANPRFTRAYLRHPNSLRKLIRPKLSAKIATARSSDLL